MNEIGVFGLSEDILISPVHKCTDGEEWLIINGKTNVIHAILFIRPLEINGMSPQLSHTETSKTWLSLHVIFLDISRKILSTIKKLKTN